MVISHNVHYGWILEHFDVRRAFLYERYELRAPVYICEEPRADGSYKHGNTVGLLIKNLYGNPSGTFYYVEGILEFLKCIQAKLNDAEACLIHVKMPSGMVIAAFAMDEFLVTAEKLTTRNEFYNIMSTKYDIKRLGKPKRYLGWHFHHAEDGSIALSQRLLMYKTLQDAGLLDVNGKATTYLNDTLYHGPGTNDVLFMDTLDKYRCIVGELRYISDSTRPYIAYIVGRLGAA